MEFMVLDTCKPPRGFIYLQASPESCFARLRERARAGEEAVTLEYMQQLHDWHEKFMITREGIDPRVAQVPVLVLDATVDLRNNTAVAASYIAQVKAFMQDRIGSEQVMPARVLPGEFSENFG
jgi:deoxyadenosine/deoxycytidine kinase